MLRKCSLLFTCIFLSILTINCGGGGGGNPINPPPTGDNEASIQFTSFETAVQNYYSSSSVEQYEASIWDLMEAIGGIDSSLMDVKLREAIHEIALLDAAGEKQSLAAFYEGFSLSNFSFTLDGLNCTTAQFVELVNTAILLSIIYERDIPAKRLAQFLGSSNGNIPSTIPVLDENSQLSMAQSFFLILAFTSIVTPRQGQALDNFERVGMADGDGQYGLLVFSTGWGIAAAAGYMATGPAGITIVTMGGMVFGTATMRYGIHEITDEFWEAKGEWTEYHGGNLQTTPVTLSTCTEDYSNKAGCPPIIDPRASTLTARSNSSSYIFVDNWGGPVSDWDWDIERSAPLSHNRVKITDTEKRQWESWVDITTQEPDQYDVVVTASNAWGSHECHFTLVVEDVPENLEILHVVPRWVQINSTQTFEVFTKGPAVTSVEWDLSGIGSQVEPGSPTAKITEYSGVFPVKVHVWAEDGQEAEETVYVEVYPREPEIFGVEHSPRVIYVDEPVTFHGNECYNMPANIEWTWYFEYEVPIANPRPSVSFDTLGHYYAKVSALNMMGYDEKIFEFDVLARPAAYGLVVGEIQGNSSVSENSYLDVSIVVSGDTGIHYTWRVSPLSAGAYSNLSVPITSFYAYEVSADTNVTISVEVSSDHCGPVKKSKEITITNSGSGSGTINEVEPNGDGDSQNWKLLLPDDTGSGSVTMGTFGVDFDDYWLISLPTSGFSNTYVTVYNDYSGTSDWGLRLLSGVLSPDPDVDLIGPGEHGTLRANPLFNGEYSVRVSAMYAGSGTKVSFPYRIVVTASN